MYAQTSLNKNLVWERAYNVWLAPNDSMRVEAVWQAFEGYCREGADSSASCRMMANLLSEPLNVTSEVWRNRCYNAALYFMKHQQKEQARFWWETYSGLAADSTCTAHWMQIMLYDTLNFSATNSRVDWWACRNCLQLKPKQTPAQWDRWVKRSAYILPGFGMVIKGYPKEGLIAFGLSAGLGYGVYRLAHRKLYWSAAGIASLFLIKFYSGNIQLTGKLQYRKANILYNKTADACRHRLLEAWEACTPTYR